ncbi:maltase A1-like [Diorhabda carinulata]|uniref:maltase A1-like n=1 Tax=Diorhabda carinulata TaxID=1163345 RepID=UPI0025A24123|nr:maltase A1-like [Diorhabda carinulata]
MISKTVAIAIVFFSTSYSQFCNNLNDNGDLDWWQTAVFYQIYPRSFMDSDGDGIGDLKGITSKLDYLKNLGVSATWLSPIFDSPQVDQGYDIRNYYEIDKDYGTMEDFKSLLEAAKELGIKIILDFVPNHTSDQHDWFLLSANRTKGYEDFYIWRDGKDGDPHSPPNNWLSEFKGSAWKWHEGRQQYYFHDFSEQQPDLNYRNPMVLEEMKKVILFWLDMGVSGFRMDAVPFLVEDATFSDAPLARGYTACDIDPICLNRENILKDLDETYNIIYSFRALVDDYAKRNNLADPIVIMTEAYTTPENTVLYYGSSTDLGAHFTFNFNLLTNLPNSNFTVDDIANAINKWQVYLPKGATSNWVLGNHDNHRVASRVGQDNVDGFNMLTALLPGVMVTYNGEEIGMPDGEVTCEQGKDPAAIKNCSTFDQTSRDFERTPFQWDSSKYAGFSTSEPWLPVGSSKNWLNLAAQIDVKSHYSVYKDLITLKENFKKRSIVDNLSIIKVNEQVLQVVRQRDEADYILLFNIGNSDQTITFYRKATDYKVVVTSITSQRSIGEKIDNLITLKGHESLILRSAELC